MDSGTAVGAVHWTMRTAGRVEPAQRRRVIADLARAHIGNAVGRLGLLAHLDPGRNAHVPPARLLPPDSALTRAARDVATRTLPPTWLNHSYRAWTFGRAVGELEQVDVDAELLFAAAMLHDTGLARPPKRRTRRVPARSRSRRRRGRLRSWDLPRATLAAAVRDHPRDGFTKHFAEAWADESARVPQGRARLLRRYGAFATAIRLAPFDE